MAACYNTVRDQAAAYTVTLHGQPVTVIRPYTVTEEADQRKSQLAAELAELAQLAIQIGKNWQSPQSCVELLQESREESACR